MSVKEKGQNPITLSRKELLRLGRVLLGIGIVSTFGGLGLINNAVSIDDTISNELDIAYPLPSIARRKRQDELRKRELVIEQTVIGAVGTAFFGPAIILLGFEMVLKAGHDIGNEENPKG